jgi:Lipocalin-like domain
VPSTVDSGAGWDWHSIQPADGRQYMLYFIRDKSGAIAQTLGTLIVDGQTTNLDPATFSETTTGSWTSPATGITYASGWRLNVPGGHLTVTPDLLNSELNLLSTRGGRVLGRRYGRARCPQRSAGSRRRVHRDQPARVTVSDAAPELPASGSGAVSDLRPLTTRRTLLRERAGAFLRVGGGEYRR